MSGDLLTSGGLPDLSPVEEMKEGVEVGVAWVGVREDLILMEESETIIMVMVAVMKNGIMDTEKLMKGRSGREGNMTGMETGIGTLREEEGL